MTTADVWKVMLAIVIKPVVAVARVATRPRVATKPPPPKPRFDDSSE